VEKGSKARTKVHLVRSDEPEPEIKLKARAGVRYEVAAAFVVDTSLERVAEEAEDPDAVSATLCAGHGTCIAIVEVGDEALPPE
jgi:hypothetical protein